MPKCVSKCQNTHGVTPVDTLWLVVRGMHRLMMTCNNHYVWSPWLIVEIADIVAYACVKQIKRVARTATHRGDLGVINASIGECGLDDLAGQQLAGAVVDGRLTGESGGAETHEWQTRG